jgi:hypothetical protein
MKAAKPKLVVHERTQPAPARLDTLGDVERALAANIEQAAAHRRSIADFEARRQALLLTDGNDAELKQLGDAVDDAYLQIEKLEARRPAIIQRQRDLQDVERARLRDELVAAHAGVWRAYVTAHRQTIQAVAAVFAARAALGAAGFSNEMNALPLPPSNLIDLGACTRGVIGNPALDHFEVDAERAHRTLAAGAQ